jgi:hypothetical protein
MLLIENVLDQMGELTRFIALDFQYKFWQISMAPENILKICNHHQIKIL